MSAPVFARCAFGGGDIRDKHALYKMLHMKHACYMQKARDDMQHAACMLV